MVSSSESNIVPIQSTGPSLQAVDGQLATEGSSEDQAIIIPCFPDLPDLGPTSGTGPDGAD